MTMDGIVNQLLKFIPELKDITGKDEKPYQTYKNMANLKVQVHVQLGLALALGCFCILTFSFLRLRLPEIYESREKFFRYFVGKHAIKTLDGHRLNAVQAFLAGFLLFFLFLRTRCLSLSDSMLSW
ncbi:hypothetical protein DSO57_1026467 [Entomophthora muscae]|uniref:Uncharacterized protein n=1 Tax=Entomophthora muscae TaxID=34485 RepID=A0ACC2SR33_9FUNG|nr:hypothetical protein DSO57_1026467 [Entomophthora muscae]